MLGRCCMECSDTNKKNKLHNPSVLQEMNFLSLINPLLAHVYWSTTLSNHGLIRLKKSSRKLVAICVINYFLVYI